MLMTGTLVPPALVGAIPPLFFSACSRTVAKNVDGAPHFYTVR